MIYLENCNLWLNPLTMMLVISPTREQSIRMFIEWVCDEVEYK